MSTWIRLDIDLDAHPDMIAAGDYALDVFVAVLRMAKQYGEAGAVHAKYVSARYLARRMLWPASRAKDITTALMGLLDVGLLIKTAEGFEVPGWRRFQQDKSGAERSRRYRERKRNVSERDATAVTPYGTGQDPTQPNETRPDLSPAGDGDGLTGAEIGQQEQQGSPISSVWPAVSPQTSTIRGSVLWWSGTATSRPSARCCRALRQGRSPRGSASPSPTCSRP